MTSLLLAALAGTGTALWWWPRPGPGPASRNGVTPRAAERWRLRLERAGLEGVGPGAFLRASTTSAAATAGLSALALGWSPLCILAGLGGALTPVGYWRSRHRVAMDAARTHWPRLLEELRVQVGPLGRSIPQALLDVGSRAPEVLQPAFRAAQREWNLRTDLERMLQVLTDRLDDATADATCETLLVIHQVGGDPDQRLADLAESRRQDLLDRRESDARQAGARLARWFVIVVPVGMAVAGANVGDGLAAYRTATAQVLIACAVALVAVCWWWAGRLMRLPEEARVFAQ